MSEQSAKRLLKARVRSLSGTLSATFQQLDRTLSESVTANLLQEAYKTLHEVRLLAASSEGVRACLRFGIPSKLSKLVAVPYQLLATQSAPLRQRTFAILEALYGSFIDLQSGIAQGAKQADMEKMLEECLVCSANGRPGAYLSQDLRH